MHLRVLLLFFMKHLGGSFYLFVDILLERQAITIDVDDDLKLFLNKFSFV